MGLTFQNLLSWTNLSLVDWLLFRNGISILIHEEFRKSPVVIFYNNEFLQNSDKIFIRIPGQKSSQFVTWTVGNFQMVVETQGSSGPMINNFFNQWTYWEVYILQFNFFWQLNDLQTQYIYTIRTVNS